jgi:uncharacterized protein (TIGR02300 family)
MPAKDLGVKHTCWKCGTKFYDMKKASPACPKCGSDPRAAPVVKPPTAAERRKAVKEEVAGDEATDPLEDAAVDEDLAEEPDEPEEPEEDA